MSYSEQALGYIAFAKQSAKGTIATAGDGNVLLTTGGQGGRLTKAAVESATVRRDAMSLRGKHGSRKTAGAYTSELFIGQFEAILEAVMRGAWSSADLTLAAADMTSITVAAHTITAAGGSWITKGLRVGHVVRLSGSAEAANNGRSLRITGLTATVITVAETLTPHAGADTDFSLIRPGRVLINPAEPVKTYWTLEEHELAIDSSEVFQDCLWSSAKFSFQPDGNVMVDTNWIGTGQMDTKTGADAPYFTDPDEITDEPLSATGATVSLNGEDMLDLTSADITIDIQANAPSVVAPPSNPYAPDVFAGSVLISMNLTALRKDVAAVADFIDETQMSLHMMFARDGDDPDSDFLSIFVPNFTLGSVDKSALSKQGGPRTITMAVPSALVGIDKRGGAFDPTMITIQSTASAA
jgi:hypothetical protein